MIRRDYDGINTLLVKEKKAGCTNWRTKTAYTLKPTAIHQIISEREYTYSHCSSITGWADRWYHYDLLGSVTALTDGDGQVIALYEQDAYGNVLSGTTPGLNRHLTGKELDPDTGLYYFGARWYDPRTAQWIEPEPYTLDGPNLYWYGKSEMINGFDPDGLYWWQVDFWANQSVSGGTAKRAFCTVMGSAAAMVPDVLTVSVTGTAGAGAVGSVGGHIVFGPTASGTFSSTGGGLGNPQVGVSAAVGLGWVNIPSPRGSDFAGPFTGASGGVPGIGSGTIYGGSGWRGFSVSPPGASIGTPISVSVQTVDYQQCH